ncbi:hypothetical protein NP173_23850, partial [Salmonella enterica]|nr:hypothetical protein [Salmonella enterica]
ILGENIAFGLTKTRPSIFSVLNITSSLIEGFEKRRNPPRSTVGQKQGLLSLRREQSNLALSLIFFF